MRGLVKSAGLYPSWKSITVMGEMPRSMMCALSGESASGETGGRGMGRTFGVACRHGECCGEIGIAWQVFLRRRFGVQSALPRQINKKSRLNAVRQPALPHAFSSPSLPNVVQAQNAASLASLPRRLLMPTGLPALTSRRPPQASPRDTGCKTVPPSAAPG